VGNRVSISDGNGLYVYANSFLGSVDPTFRQNVFDRPGANRATGYGAFWQILNAAVTTRDFTDLTVHGNDTRTVYAMYFYYGQTSPTWTFNLRNLHLTNLTNSPGGGLFFLRSTVSIYDSNLTAASQAAVRCQECTARLVDTQVYELSATVTTNGEVTALQRFGARRMQWQGDGGMLIPSGNLHLQWRGPFSAQTIMTIPFVGGAVDNTSVPMWRRTTSLADAYTNLTPVFRQAGVDLPGVQIPFTSPFWGNVTIIDPDLPDLTYTTPAPNSQIRVHTIVVKGNVRDTTTGVAGVQVGVNGANFSNTSSFDPIQGTWETSVTFPGDGKYNITIHAWDRARWAITYGNYTTGFKEVVITGIVIDTVAPQIVFITPTADLTQNNRNISVVGQVLEENPLSRFTITFQGAAVQYTLGQGGLFTVNRSDLTEGPNQITVVATDGAGNTNVASRTITLDTIAPHLVIVSPVNQSSTNRAVVTVTGEVESGVELRVNGLEVTLPYPFTLNPGSNLITVVATDQGGNIATVVRVVSLDLQPPTVTFVDPARFPFDTRSARVVLTATANEPLRSVSLNNITYPLSTPTTFTVEIYLDDGTHILVLSVTDMANNTAEVSPAPVIRVDTAAPSLVIDRPADGAVQGNRVVTVCGRTDTNVGLNVTGPLGRLQIPVTNPLTGEFCYEDTRTADGRFQYDIEATDGVGNVVMRSVTVVVDTIAPEVEVRGLGTNHETTESSLSLEGKISPGSMLTVNGTPIAVVCNPNDPSGLCDYSVLLPVAEGQSTLTILATDAAGNVQVKTINVLRHAEATQSTFDFGPALVGAGLAVGLVLFLLFWTRLHGAAARENPGLARKRSSQRQKKRDEKRKAARPPPEVIYEVDSQAMYRDDFDSGPPR
jgi:hypothetical protein